MKPDLRDVTLICYENRHHAAALSLMAAMTRAADFGAARLLNHFQGWHAFNYWENFETWKYVTTDFSLCMHLDGYMLRPQLWDPAWLAYDYIGAPWPYALNADRVGNGGFCLKSRRLLNRVASLPLPKTDKPVPGDVLLCSHFRQQLIEEGFKFAPVAVAARFSVENPVRETPAETFGFHGTLKHPLNDYPIWNADWTELPAFEPRKAPPAARADEIGFAE